MQYKLENIKKSYDGKVVLDIPEFSIESGQIYMVVGPNGAGKTTLLNLLSFLDTPTKGKIIYNNTPVPTSGRALLNLRRKVTLVMQEHLLFDTSVYSNVAYGLKKRGYPREVIEAKTSKALKLVGLDHLTERRARTLSGGESKRLSIARAVVIEPEVLILDEPTANIDRQNMESIERLILEINGEKHTRPRLGEVGQVTVICTTHNLNQAYRLGHKVMSLVEGRLVETRIENIFYGELHPNKNLKWMEVAPGVKIWLDTEKEGKAHILIDPRDIIISRTSLTSSARNSFRGQITTASREGKITNALLGESRLGRVKLSINAGTTFTVFITKDSFEEMNLKLGEEVFLTFKTSSVMVL